jgi:hypothetical protein
MKIISFFILSFLLNFISCRQTDKRKSDVEQKTKFFIKDHFKKFKHSNIQNFPKGYFTDLNTKRAIYEIHTPIIKDLYLQIFQDTSRVDTVLSEGTKVLYSIQKLKGYQGILIAGMNDAWVDDIIYRTYDMNGKFISELVLYQNGGDGGYYTQGFGRFVNDTTYFKYTIECEIVDMEKNIEKCDSVALKYYIHNDGKIEPFK